MPTGLWWFPIAAGLKDGLNPCLVMTAAAVLLGLLWFKRAGVNPLWSLLFIVFLIGSALVLNCGYLDQFILNKYFEKIVPWVYFITGILIGLKGISFFRQWYDLCKGKEIKPEASFKKPSILSLIFLISLSGVLLALLATVWPINYYMVVFSIYMSMPGQFIPLGILMLTYTVISFWLVYLVIWISTIDGKNPRLFKIIASAILLSASLGTVSLIL